jgi:hypothetical protein
MAVELSGRRWLFHVFTVTGLTAVVSFILAVEAANTHSEALATVNVVFLAAIVAKLGLSVWVTRMNLIVRLMTTGQVGKIWFLWIVCSAAFVTFFAWVPEWPLADRSLIFKALVLLVPLNRFLLSPITLAWNRHS